MAKEKSLVEEAIIQMKNLEEAVAENAKGILASTMKEEIKELVKESLSEQEDDDKIEVDAKVDIDAPEGDEMGADNTELDMDMDDMDMDDTDDEDTIDLTDVEDEDEILRVFSLAGPEDNIVVVKDEAGNINLKDNENEYMIVGEGEDYVDGIDSELEEMVGTNYMDMEEDMYEEEDVEEGEESIESIVERIFMSEQDGDDEYDMSGMEMEEGNMYEMEPELDEMVGADYMSDMEEGEGSEEIVYEIVMDEEDSDELEEIRYGSFGNLKRKDFRGDEYVRDDDRFASDEEIFGIGDDEFDTEEFGDFELYSKRFPEDDEDSPRWFKGRQGKTMFDAYREKTGKPFKVKTRKSNMEDMDEPMMEAKMTMKPKGVGMGRPKFSYDKKPNLDLPTKKQKHGGKGIGFGSAKKGSKFHMDKDNGQMDGEFRVKPKKVETKEAARTYGNGSKEGRGLRKAITPNRNLTFESTAKEVQILREKNEEYRKALNVFRNKLNEVAVFNSNLAYATRLFTEHSTSKQEKINILRRFDSVETIKESKNLYKAIKDELSVKTSQPMNESIERKIENVQATGSAANLIESKTYENPQFLRMKDLMAKIK